MVDIIESDVIIVGGGTAGSFFAWKLALRGFKVHLIEKKPLGTLGEHIDIFHVDEIRFDQFSIPLPEGEELIGYYSDGKAWAPDGKDPQIIDYAFYVMRLPLFISRLQRYAQESGVVIWDQTIFEKPIIESDVLKGVYASQSGNKFEFRADLIVDTSGVKSVVRSCLSPKFNIETDSITPDAMLYVILQYWTDIKGDFPRGLNFYPFHKTFCNPSYSDGAILGVGQPISFENAEKIQEQFLKERFSEFKHQILKIAKGSTPFRRPPFTLVANNFLVLGDAAYLTKPFSGEGVTAAFTACQIAVEELSTLLPKRQLSQETLWSINIRYFKDQGAKFAELLAQLPGAAELTPKDVNFLFRQNIIFSGEGLTNMNRDFEDPITFWKLLGMIRKFLWGILSFQFSIISLRKLLSALSVSGKLRKHYENYPTSLSDYDVWKEKATILWGKVQ
ncbi:MAG: NAD(P)/FAD-dependent oxidoreductase [Candidatus Heimdallarchaeota archaeon]|nr:NAD(P)/FAD-dependent oxidoreductase [Candidatus Heimdallarchaeota archaeon]